MQAQKYFKQTQNNNNTTMNNQGATNNFVQNPFLDQSINQRIPVGVSGINDGVIPNVEQLKSQSTIQRQQTVKVVSLVDYLKDNVYNVINKFRDATKGAGFADFEIFKTVMIDLIKTNPNAQQEVGQLWSQYNISNQFFYNEQLMQLYGQMPPVRQDTVLYRQYVQRNADPNTIRIKEKLFQHLVKNDLSVDQLFGFIDKDKSSTITIEEFTRGFSNGILSPDECIQLFMSIDFDQNKVLTYEELVNSCA